MNSNPQTPDPDMLTISELPMPRLSDDAVVQIHDFLHHVLDLFEARYGDQIDLFYESLCDDCCFEHDGAAPGVDPPF
jgi:hypothetical protein